MILITGDLVKDALRVSEKEAVRLYEMYVKQVNKCSVPVWSVPGNHEIFGIARHKSLVSDSRDEVAVSDYPFKVQQHDAHVP